MRYIIFSRVSTGMQRTDNQIYDCLNYVNAIKKEGDQVIEVDESDVSTRLRPEQRPILLSMLTMLQKGDTLVVFCLTRLARKGLELINIYQELADKKVEIISLSQPKIDEVFIHLYAMGGQMERNSNSIRTKSALKHKQSKMEKVGTCWYGYKTDEATLQPRKDVRSSGKPYLLVPDEAEQINVAIIKELQAKGLSWQEIADQANARGCRNRAGNPFQKMTAWRIFHREETRNPTLLLQQAVLSR